MALSAREAIHRATESLGGKLEAFYYAFGESDAYSIVEVPDNATAAAASMTVSAVGVAHNTTVVLITPEEIDEVSKTSRHTYRAAPSSWRASAVNYWSRLEAPKGPVNNRTSKY